MIYSACKLNKQGDNIQPSQSDYFQAVKGGSHGDFKKIVLAPASVQEMADLTSTAGSSMTHLPEHWK